MLFDLDGVLIDSEPEYSRIWTEIGKSFGVTDPIFSTKIKGCTLPEILNLYFEPRVHGEVILKLNEKEQKMHYAWLPGAHELLKEIKDRGIPAALVTSSNEIKMRHLHDERPELAGYFECLITADMISRSKPDPEGYLLGAQKIGIPAERCIVFEDSLQGVKAGRAAGAYVVGLCTTLPAEQLSPYCDQIVRDLSEIKLNE